MRSLRPVSLLIFALCCVVLVAAGCSMPSFAYSNAPGLISWRASSYFDLDPAQHAEFRQGLERGHAWHRREQLPLVVATLREGRRRVDGEIAVTDAEWFVAALQDHYREAVERVVDETAGLIPTLRPSQIDAFERKLADVDEEFVEEWLEPPADEIRRARFERVIDRAEEWLGRLEPAQRDWLRQRLDEIPADFRAARADRLRRQQELIALLRGEAAMVRTAEDIAGRLAPLKRWASDWNHGRSPGDLERLDRFARDYRRLYVDLINGATPEQRDHLRRRLDSYADALAKHIR